MNGRSGIRGLRAERGLDSELLRFTSSSSTATGFLITLDRSPSFFDALEVEGENPVVAAFVLDDPASDAVRVVGTSVMTERPVFVNGSDEPTWIGQLGSARIDPAHRSGMLVVRNFRQLHDWHLGGRARVFLTTILEDNAVARATFESGRAGLPTYCDRGRLVTLSIAVGSSGRGPRVSCPSSDFEVVQGQAGDVEDVVAFWRNHGPRRQFFPAYDEGHLRDDRGLLRGLGVEDILLARSRSGGELLGTLGLWNQSAFRRWRVDSLPRGLALSVPFINVVARLRGGLPLPRCGGVLPQRFAATLCVAEDDAGVFGALLGAARQRIAAQGGAWLNLGLHENDALLPLVRRSRPRELHSRLYLVHWPEGREAAGRIEGDRCPYVELGGL